MKRNSITEFELEKQGYRIRLKRVPPELGKHEDALSTSVATKSFSLEPSGEKIPPQPQPPLQQPLSTATQHQQEVIIKSPMVGTFYRAPAPGAPPFVDIGSQVNPDTIICIIEAMKVMNEIKAEVTGTITAILAENGKAVEYGQPLFKIRPA